MATTCLVLAWEDAGMTPDTRVGMWRGTAVRLHNCDGRFHHLGQATTGTSRRPFTLSTRISRKTVCAKLYVSDGMEISKKLLFLQVEF